MLWRRSYDVPPPPLDDDDEWSPGRRPAYADLADEILPRTECLADVVDRMLPYWYDAIVPDLRTGRTVCVAAHGNSLRALVKHLDGISEEAVVGLNIPTGIPLVYELDDAPAARPGPAASTSTRTRPPPPSGRSRTRVADPARPGQGSRCGVLQVVDGGDRLAGDQEDHPAGHGDGVVGDPLVVAAEQGDVDGRLDAVGPESSSSSSGTTERRSRSISSSSSSRRRAPSTSRSAMIAGDRADHLLGDGGHALRSSAPSPRGSPTSGTRSRATFATCTERSPIRSSSPPSASPRRASAGRPRRAAGGPAARRPLSSTRSRAASMSASSEMTCSAISASRGEERPVERTAASCTSRVIVTSSSTIVSSWSK